VFLTLYLFEISKNNENTKNLKTQVEVNKTLNKKISSLSTSNIQNLKNNESYSKPLDNKELDNMDIYIFGIADEFKIICPTDKQIKINSMYTKIVDDVSNTSTINDITNFVSAFPMLHNTNHVSLNTKLISDNLRLSIPYAMPNDEIVKTRVIYGNYTCIPKN